MVLIELPMAVRLLLPGGEASPFDINDPTWVESLISI